MGQILSEDPFFCSSPVLGENMGRILSEDLFFLLFTCFWGRILSVTILNSNLCFSQIV